MFNQSTRSVPLTPPSASTSTREEEDDDRDNHADFEGACDDAGACGDAGAWDDTEYEGACDENVDHVEDGTGHAYTPIFSRNLSDSWRDNTNMMARKIDFGTAHPNYNQPVSKKAKWTDAELDVIKKWIQDNQSETKNKIAKCLAAIRLDISLHPIFHTRQPCV